MSLNLRKLASKLSLSAFAGILAGVGAAIFLHLLEGVTQTRENHLQLILFLPLAGLISGLSFYAFGHFSHGATHRPDSSPKGKPLNSQLILEEIHDPKHPLPFRMAPLILFGTLLSHLFGASVGREGTAVQIGASLSDQLSRFFQISLQERKWLLIAGMSAGFSSALGAPLAGTLFGMEVVALGQLGAGALLHGLLHCGIASFFGYSTSVLLHTPHTDFPSIAVPPLSLGTLTSVACAGIAFGLTARFFIRLTHGLENTYERLKVPHWVRPAAGGLILVGLFYFLKAPQYAGLGIPLLRDAFTSSSSFSDPFYKGIFTSLSIASGFKGGEFVPLMVIGSTLGSALSHVLPASAPLLAAIGAAAVFGGASHTPIACAVLAIELFGLPLTPYALVGCLLSAFVSGPPGIYSSPHRKSQKHGSQSGILLHLKTRIGTPFVESLRKDKK